MVVLTARRPNKSKNGSQCLDKDTPHRSFDKELTRFTAVSVELLFLVDIFVMINIQYSRN